ncbi:MAG: YcxB family protein [Clostridia bacterium]|nr:YcxB family protein [Clostridia bacterium]
MEIRAKSKFDLESIRALCHLQFYGKANPKVRMRIKMCCFIALISLIVVELVIFGFARRLLILLGIWLLMILLECLAFFIYPKIQFKAMAKLQNAENQYTFCDDVLKVVTVSDYLQGSEELQYSLFVKVYETSEFIFLFQTKTQVLIVDKSTIENGTEEELHEKLTASVQGKYIVCHY